MTVRTALAATLADVDYDGEDAIVFDYFSRELTEDNIEKAVFTGLGVFIGDSRASTEPYCHGWTLVRTEYDCWIAEKRPDQRSAFESYFAALGSALPPSNLGGVVGNILGVEISKTEEVQHPIEAVWYLPVTITVTHLQPVTIGSEFRINVDLPTCEIDQTAVDAWAAAGGSLSYTIDIAKGTGIPNRVYAIVTNAIGGAIVYIQAINENDTTVTVDFGLQGIEIWTGGISVTFRAVVTDALGAYGTDTYEVTTGS